MISRRELLKNLSHRLGLYWNISVGSEAACIMQDGTESTASMNWVTRTTHPDGAIEWKGERNKNKGDDRQNEKEHTKLDRNVNRRYIVDRVIRHLKTPTETRYVVHWCGYTKDDDITEPAENITQHFRDAHWWRVWKKGDVSTET